MKGNELCDLGLRKVIEPSYKMPVPASLQVILAEKVT